MAGSSTKAKRLVYWLTPRISPLDLDLCEALTQVGFEVKTSTSIDDLEKLAFEARPGVITLTDHGNQDEVARLLTGLLSLPELMGAKLVMVSFFGNESLKLLAAGSNFRDIIPAYLSVTQFQKRFQDAITIQSAQTAAFHRDKSIADIGLKLHLKAVISLPCRITQLGPETLKVESRLKPDVGSRLLLAGKVSQALNQPTLSLEVTERFSTGLIHRFSSGFIAKWHEPQLIPPIDRAAENPFWLQVTSRCHPHEIRVFVAMSDPKLRRLVLTCLNENSFIITMALQRKSLASEPPYLAPDFVILDEKIALENQGITLSTLLSALPPKSHIFVTGDSENLSSRLHKLLEDPLLQTQRERVKIVTQEQLQDSISMRNTLIQRYLEANPSNPNTPSDHKNPPLNKSDPSSPHVEPIFLRPLDPNHRFLLNTQDPWTYGQLVFSGIIRALNYPDLELVLPFSMKPFSIFRLQCPEITHAINRSPFAKIMSYQRIQSTDGEIPSHKETQHLYRATLADISQDEFQQLAQWSIKSVSDAFEKHAPLKPVDQVPFIDPAQQTNPATPLPDKSADGAATRRGEDKTPGPHMITSSIAEISRELGREAFQGLKDTLEGHKTKGWLRSMVPVVMVSGLVLGILWGIFAYLAKDFKKSGSIYTDQLKQFSP